MWHYNYQREFLASVDDPLDIVSGCDYEDGNSNNNNNSVNTRTPTPC